MSAAEGLTDYLRMTAAFRAGNFAKPPKYNYMCFEDYTLDRGAALDSNRLTRDEIRTVNRALKVWGKEPQPRECFYSATMITLSDRSDQIDYVEGYAFGKVSGFAIHHAWNLINGKVIDLTWRLCEHVYTHADHCFFCRQGEPRAKKRLRNRIWGTFPEGYAYRGVLFDKGAVYLRAMDTEAEGCSHIDDWKNDYPELQRERLHAPPEPLTLPAEAS